MVNLHKQTLEELVQMLCYRTRDNIALERNDILEELRERGYSREEIRHMEHNGLDPEDVSFGR